MDLNLSEIRELLTAVRSIEGTEVDVVVGNVRIVVRRGSLDSSRTSQTASPSLPTSGESKSTHPPASLDEATIQPNRHTSAQSLEHDSLDMAQWIEKETQGTVSIVRSPMVGTAYRAKEPGEEPFIRVGDQVTEGDVVALVEVMKLFHSVEAKTVGTVAAILFEDGDIVEYEQPLVAIQRE